MTTRRAFIKNSSLLSTAILFDLKELFESSPKNIGLQMYTVRDILKTNSITDVISRIAKTGYKELEVTGYNYQDKYWGLDPKAFRTLMETYGLTAPSAHVSFDQFFTNGNTEPLKIAMDAAKTIGNKYITLGWLDEKFRKNTDDYKIMADKLNIAGELCRQAGLQLAYHNHDFEFTKTEGEKTWYDILLTNTGKEAVKFELDLFWATKAGVDPVKIFEKDPGRFVMWHIKDMDKTTRSFTEVGSGVVEFKKIFAQQELSGMNHFFVEQDVVSGDVFKSIEQSFQYVKKKLV